MRFNNYRLYGVWKLCIAVDLLLQLFKEHWFNFRTPDPSKDYQLIFFHSIKITKGNI